MKILKDVLTELFGMFLGDAWLSTAILAVVALTALAIDLGGAPPMLGGVLLLIGSLGVLIGAVLRAARQKLAPTRVPHR
ncbi:hypothetical protein B6V73_09835 [Thioclava sp. JM3]|uniref:hypothetical protein n=1 Tax=Thioclava sp. JM3 TaxID=1973004 RepID=UPI000B53F4FD|nr:hypothetical protein [Thioclava sp. JM3]OWY17130.1 hypothetical protein B6V73_09835 [Thioclava sp. JM3]